MNAFGLYWVMARMLIKGFIPFSNQSKIRELLAQTIFEESNSESVNHLTCGFLSGDPGVSFA